jgi:hypothetical protein
MEHSLSQPTHPTGGHETREVNIKLILLSTLGMVILVLVVCFVTVGIFNYLSSTQAQPERANELSRPMELPRAPRVQEHPWEEYKVLHANEARVLNSYGWVNEADGTVRIPIDRAIDLIAERGLPVESSATASPKEKKKGMAPAAKPQATTAALVGEEHVGQ